MEGCIARMENNDFIDADDMSDPVCEIKDSLHSREKSRRVSHFIRDSKDMSRFDRNLHALDEEYENTC